VPRKPPSDVEPAAEPSDAATGDLDASEGTPGDVGSWPGDQQKAWDVAPDLFDAPAPPGPSEAAPIYVHVEDAPAVAPKAKRARKAKPPVDAPQAYRVRQACYGPAGRLRAGDIVVLPPSSGLARSLFVTLLESDEAPAEVAAALAAAEDQ
jgi:hypothetical protein